MYLLGRAFEEIYLTLDGRILPISIGQFAHKEAVADSIETGRQCFRSSSVLSGAEQIKEVTGWFNSPDWLF